MNSITEKSNELGSAPLGPLILKYSLPAIAGMLVQALYNVADRFFLGNGVGPDAIAGVAIGFPLMLLMMAFGMLVGIGGNAAFSIYLGQGKKDLAEQTLGNSLTLLVLFSALLTVVGLVLMEPMMRLFGASDQTLPFASSYMTIVLAGCVFNSLGFGLNNFIRADGAPQRAMMTMIAGALLNLILDPILIFGFNMGVEGAALATVVSQVLSTILVIWYFFSPKSHVKFHIKNLPLKATITLRILSIGLAPFMMQVAASGLNALLNNQLKNYGGDLAISAMGVIYSIALFFMMPIFGLNQGVAPIIGFNYGAKKYPRVLKATNLAGIAATTFTFAASAALLLFPAWFVGLFNQEPELVALGESVARVFFLMFTFLGFQIVMANYFQSVGKPLKAMILSLSRQILFLVPLLIILPPLFEGWGWGGFNGVLWAIPLSDALAILITGLVFWGEVKHLKAGDPVQGSQTPVHAMKPAEAPHLVDAVNGPGEIL